MRWEKQRNGKWKLIGPAKGKVDPDDPTYITKLRAQMKKINPFCKDCGTTYNLADPCYHHLTDSPEDRAKYKSWVQSQRKKKETVEINNQTKL